MITEIKLAITRTNGASITLYLHYQTERQRMINSYYLIKHKKSMTYYQRLCGWFVCLLITFYCNKEAQFQKAHQFSVWAPCGSCTLIICSFFLSFPW